MTQLGYIYNNVKKEVLLAVTVIYNDGICHIKYLRHTYPCSDTIVCRLHDFRKTPSWKESKKQYPDTIFEEKFNDF